MTIKLTAETNGNIMANLGTFSDWEAATQRIAEIDELEMSWDDDWDDAFGTDTETGERFIFEMGCWCDMTGEEKH